MKKIITILSMGIFVMACGFGWSHFSVLKKLAIYFRKEHESENGEDEAKDASGMADFLGKMRNNQATGSINLSDYYKAREDAEKFQSTGMRGGLNLHWQSMGPDNQGGRSRSLLIDKNDPTHLFCGGVSGGLWVSTNSGASWDTVPGSSRFSSLIVSCIAQAGNGHIYFGTGEYFYFGNQIPGGGVVGAAGFPGGGIWASSDDGKSFKNIKAPANSGIINSNAAFSFVTSMATDPTDNNRVYVAIQGSASVKPLQVITLDGSGSDIISNAPGTFSGSNVATDVEVSSTGVAHAVIGTKYFRLNNFSTGFVAVTSNLPNTGVTRVVLAVSQQDPNYVYAIASTNAAGIGDVIKGLWESTDGGNTFTQLAGQSIPGSLTWIPVTQGGYALTLEVSPVDKNLIIFGGLDVYRYSSSLGAEKISNWNFSELAPEYVHADIHSFRFMPNSNAMFVTSDGGINYSSDVSASNVIWTTLNNQLVTTQCYDVCAKNYTGEILTGMQDNGSWYINFRGNSPRFGTEVKGGDGGTVAVSTINPNLLFAEYVDGALARSSNNGGSFADFFDNNIDCNPNSAGTCAPDGNPDDGAPFIAQYKLWENPKDPNPQTQSKFALGTGDPDTYNNSNVWLTQDALNLVTTPVWFKITKTQMNAPVSCLAFSSDGKTIFAGTENGGLYRIDGLDSILHYTVDSATKKASFNPDSFHITTTMINNFGSGRFVTDIAVDTNKNHVVVTLGNYGNTDYVYQSLNAADTSVTPTWTNITGTGLPRMPVYCALIDKRSPNNIIIGTEIGIYSTIDQGQHWSVENNGMPNVPVYRLYRHIFNSRDNIIEAATYGRGIYRDTTIGIFTTLGVQNVTKESSTQVLKLFPNPSSSSITLNALITRYTDAEVNIYSIQGKLVKTQIIKQVTPGYRNLDLNVSDLSVGTYLLTLKGNSLNMTSKFLIIR